MIRLASSNGKVYSLYGDNKSFLYHHGILGQKWGKKNGPPYPLDPGDHSKAEKKAGWKNSLSRKAGEGGRNSSASSTKTSEASRKPSETGTNHGLSPKAKRAIAIGAAAAATGLAIYGIHKAGGIDGVYDGLSNLLNKNSSVKLYGELHHRFPKRISETAEQTLKSVNPNLGKLNSHNNCSSCSIAGVLRSIGYDVTAKADMGQGANLNGVIEDIFGSEKVKGHIFDGSAVEFAKSPERAAEILKRRFGNNAKGAVAIDLGGKIGHIFSWTIQNGKVSFSDYQRAWGDKFIRNWLFPQIIRNGSLQIARFDDLIKEADWSRIAKYVDLHF